MGETQRYCDHCESPVYVWFIEVGGRKKWIHTSGQPLCDPDDPKEVRWAEPRMYPDPMLDEVLYGRE